MHVIPQIDIAKGSIYSDEELFMPATKPPRWVQFHSPFSYLLLHLSVFLSFIRSFLWYTGYTCRKTTPGYSFLFGWVCPLSSLPTSDVWDWKTSSGCTKIYEPRCYLISFFHFLFMFVLTSFSQFLSLSWRPRHVPVVISASPIPPPVSILHLPLAPSNFLTGFTTAAIYYMSWRMGAGSVLGMLAITVTVMACFVNGVVEALVYILAWSTWSLVI